MEDVIALVLQDADEGRIRHALVARPADIEAVARVAADVTQSKEARLAALCGVVDATSVLGRRLPAPMADAVADPSLIDAAIALGRANSVIATLHGLARDGTVVAARAEIVRKLIAAHVRGINLAYLAVEIGDYESAVTLALVDFEEHIADRITKDPSDPVISAWLAFVVNVPEPVRREFLAAFGDRKDALLSLLWPQHRAKLDSQ